MWIQRNIRERRLALGMTQLDLAKKLGYKDSSSITKIEKGDTQLTLNQIVKFAEVLQVSPDDLMGFDDYIMEVDDVTAKYNRLNDENRRLITEMMERLIEGQKK